MWAVSETGLSGFIFGLAGGRIRPRRPFWISLSPRRKWAIPWTQTCCRNYRGRPGWQPRYWRDLRRTCFRRDLIVASRQDTTLCEWVQSGEVPTWSDCAGLSPELRCWLLQIGNLSVDTEGRLWRRRAPPSGASQLVVPHRERQDMIRRFHDSLFARHLGVSRTVSCLLAGIASRRLFLPGIMYCLSGTQVSVSTEGFHGTC